MKDSSSIAKTYSPKTVEEKLYKKWIEGNWFHATPDKDKKPFCIVIPPPNITGQLHMGHALDNTIQDVLIRWRRMQGYSTLWMPGTDHASIATEAKLVAALASEGLTKEEVGRDEFLVRAWKWREVYGGRIIEQLKRLGCSCDWERERFTMDEGLSEAVLEVFIRLYEKGLIYRGDRIINWCTKCCTSISDAEVEYQERQSMFWYIKYPVKGRDEFIVVATTRPETMLGDTAVAVHPDDPRYKSLIGQTIILPLMEREIPIIADTYVDMELGTGAVKITPAHDPNDFEVGLRHDLPRIRVIDDHGVMNGEAGEYEGMDRYAARKRIVADLEGLDLLAKTEPHTHNVGECYRCNTVIEPLISNQWFVRMKPLAAPAIEVVKNGKTRFVPERFSKIYFNWMENIQDWCISRQLWWGHRIPVYYCDDCGAERVSRTPVRVCEKCGGVNIRQDDNTLDTWFSSALWPFSTLGWPKKTLELDYYYPTDVLVTGYDIIFFWVARMIFSGVEHMGEVPFKHVFIHGMIRDGEGRKMSKSLGNGIDPLDVIDEFGTDALRFALTIGISPGNDLRFSRDKVESARNFTNKIWNASRFLLMSIDEGADLTAADPQKFTIAERWILSRLNSLTAEVTDNLEKFELGIAMQKIYEFFWEEFCDWYIEIVKPRLFDVKSESRLEAMHVLCRVLSGSMKLLHPFMPYISEEIYCSISANSNTASLMVCDWPAYDKSLEATEDVARMELLMELIKGIRNIRADMSVPPSKKVNAVFVTADSDIADTLANGRTFIERLAYLSWFTVSDNKNAIPGNAVVVVAPGIEAFIPLDELVDVEQELLRLEKEKETLENEVKRAENKLNNPGFVAKAPQKVIEDENEKLKKYRDMLDKVAAGVERIKTGNG